MNPSEISDDEWIFRRIPDWLPYYDPIKNTLSPQSFLPRPKDKVGISVMRSSLLPRISAAALDPNNKGREFYVAKIRASNIRSLGLSIRHTPSATNLAHCSILELKSGSLDSDFVRMVTLKLARMADVEGPFPAE